MSRFEHIQRMCLDCPLLLVRHKKGETRWGGGTFEDATDGNDSVLCLSFIPLSLLNLTSHRGSLAICKDHTLPPFIGAHLSLRSSITHPHTSLLARHSKRELILLFFLQIVILTKTTTSPHRSPPSTTPSENLHNTFS